MDKQNVVYIIDEILLALKKEWNFDTCHIMDESMLSERSLTQRTNITLFYLSELPILDNFIEMEGRMVVTRNWERKEWEVII